MESFLEKLGYIEGQDIMIFSDNSVDDLVVSVCYDSQGDVTECRCFILEEKAQEIIVM